MSGGNNIDYIDGSHVKKILYRAYKGDRIVQRSYSLNTDSFGEITRTVKGIIRDDILWYRASGIDADRVEVYVNNKLYKTYKLNRENYRKDPNRK